ncbi:hypothetical protein Y032_0061g3232 [Ancylostoma ceylanicum]|uniref:Uncharacterized protein n=1 Tax=Ancylostoma ceylanicum TaxID=53326 RepID=A0A016U2N7_9BILA|nr:hypothetical protein Y032_0061g3232 [Ancylostoma ceylanicum]
MFFSSDWSLLVNHYRSHGCRLVRACRLIHQDLLLGLAVNISHGPDRFQADLQFTTCACRSELGLLPEAKFEASRLFCKIFFFIGHEYLCRLEKTALPECVPVWKDDREISGLLCYGIFQHSAGFSQSIRANTVEQD